MKQQRKVSRQQRTTPLVVGTGLIALDVVISRVSNDPTKYWCGGTCGNVLIILKYLGWRVLPIARLGRGKASKLVLADLKRWKVSTRMIRTDADVGTPIIVERITKDQSGLPRHSYSWRCNECGSPFPGYRPELVSIVEQITDRIRRPQVFFFDRVSPGALAVAKDCAAKGGLVVFEPSTIGNPVLFQQAWDLAHVVKYSHERLRELPEMNVATTPQLQIETLGEGGLRYRTFGPRRNTSWIEAKAFPVKVLKDTAGAGDWCSAGIISVLAKAGRKGFLSASEDQVADAMRYGQALAAWNCSFEGPRGGMYSVSRRVFNQQVKSILSGDTEIKRLGQATASKVANNARGLCHACDGAILTRSTGTHN
jgi:fructokinase